MAGAPTVKIPAVKGAQPADYDLLAQLVKNAEQLQLSGQSATQDVPGLMTSPGDVVPGRAYDSFRLPARVDPAQVLEAQRELARVNALQGAASFVPATVFGVKHGRSAGAPAGGGGPVWDAVREQTTAPLRAAQMDVDQQNQANDLINKIVGMNAGAKAQDRATATQLATAQGGAQVAGMERATQQHQFEESQETTRRGQELQYRAMLAKLNGPQAERLHQGRAIAAAALSGLDELDSKIDSGAASPVSGTLFGQRVGTSAGVDTANTVGMLANNLSQIAERRGLRGAQQDEIAKELNSGLMNPEAGHAVNKKWKQIVNDYVDGMGNGMYLGLDNSGQTPEDHGDNLGVITMPPPPSRGGDSSGFDPDSFIGK